MSFRVPGRVDNWDFVEFWTDPTASPPYALVLLGRSDQDFLIVDPCHEYVPVFSATSYEKAKLWLLEDEYERVEGRLFSSNGDLKKDLTAAPGMEQETTHA